MATLPTAAASETRNGASPAPPEREPNLLRFGLRQFFLFVSLTVVLSALLARIGGVWPWVIGSAVALIAAHVFGTFLGTRLRDTSDEVQRWKARPGSADRDEPIALPQPVALADLRLPETTPLAAHGAVSRWGNLLIGVGTLVGATTGAGGIYLAVGDQVTWPGLALGAVSCGVIGAWMALLASSFWSIARHAWRHAAKQSEQ